MKSAIPFEHRRAAAVAKAESLVKSVAYLLGTTHNDQEKAKLLWELGYVHLRDMEDYRVPVFAPVLIVAACLEHAKVCARERLFNQHEWRYVYEARHMRGLRGASIIFYETAWHNPHYREIRQLARAYEMEDIT